MVNSDALLKAANDRLKSANTGVTIFRSGSKLRLRGTFPAKNGVGKKQQTIALDIYFNPAGIKRAEQEAYKISSSIALKEFDWGDYIDSSPPVKAPGTLHELMREFEADYFNRRGKTFKTQATFRNYRKVFKKLEDRPLNRDYLLSVVLTTEANTKTRQLTCDVIGALCGFAGSDIKFTAYRGNYSPARVDPRELPGDDRIIETYRSIPDPRWQYIYGLMATYGLRNFECFHLDSDFLRESPGVVWVLDDKRGRQRLVWPFHPDWWERFELYNVDLLPPPPTAGNEACGKSVTDNLRRYGIKKPYNLRHAWAVRTLELGLDITLAAQQMGHSLKIHSQVYHHWIGMEVHQRAFDAIKQKNLKF